jgi:cytochrome c biogenesis protein ResB
LVTESQVTEQEELSIDGVTLTLSAVPYAQLTVVSNPGLWPTSIGILCVMIGVVGTNLWPRRRLWVREEERRIESSGDPMPTLPAKRIG